MTLVEGWNTIAAGGVGATLFVILFMIVREDLAAGRTLRREVDRNERLNAIVEKTIVLTERMMDVIEASDELNERMMDVIEAVENQARTGR